MYERHKPGEDIVDLDDVVAERDRIWEAIAAVSEERDADAIAENEADPRGDDRCSNECVCTVFEKIEAEEFDGAVAMIPMLADGEDADGLWEAAGLDSDDADFIRQVMELEAELYVSLDEAAKNEPVMIHENYFEEYAQDLANDIGAINSEAVWPNCHIDWKAAAADLATDYTPVDFGRHSYLWRAY